MTAGGEGLRRAARVLGAWKVGGMVGLLLVLVETWLSGSPPAPGGAGGVSLLAWLDLARLVAAWCMAAGGALAATVGAIAPVVIEWRLDRAVWGRRTAARTALSGGLLALGDLMVTGVLAYLAVLALSE